MSASSFKGIIRRTRNDYPESKRIKTFAASIADIDKALALKKRFTNKEIKLLLLEQYYNCCKLFSPNEAKKLPLYRPGLDYKINVIEKDGKTLEAP